MNTSSTTPGWWRRARHSLRVRLVLLFGFMVLAVGVAFLGGVGHALSTGWRGAVDPLVEDYADRLAAEIGSPPSAERAQAIAARLPLVVRISGPRLDWQSAAPPQRGARWARERDERRASVVRHSADGHRIEFALSPRARAGDPWPSVWATLAVLLALLVLTYVVVHFMLRPIRDIGAGARRFGAGRFDEPIPVRRARHADELSELAQTVNQMAADIQRMLDAKRGLLLAISHELRSPLTRARLNAELLPEGGDGESPRAALLRDLAQMRDLITDLLESERLASPHAALLREPTDLPALAREVIAQLAAAGRAELHAEPGLPVPLPLDAARMRLLLRNLLDNALRHTPAGAPPPQVRLAPLAGGGAVIEVRDHGPGVPPEQLDRLSEAFYRPDSARQRGSGGVGLGLYLARLVAQAHGGRLSVRNAAPGLAARVELPVSMNTMN